MIFAQEANFPVTMMCRPVLRVTACTLNHGKGHDLAKKREVWRALLLQKNIARLDCKNALFLYFI